jgi:hypothetical protein
LVDVEIASFPKRVPVGMAAIDDQRPFFEGGNGAIYIFVADSLPAEGELEKLLGGSKAGGITQGLDDSDDFGDA